MLMHYLRGIFQVLGYPRQFSAKKVAIIWLQLLHDLSCVLLLSDHLQVWGSPEQCDEVVGGAQHLCNAASFTTPWNDDIV